MQPYTKSHLSLDAQVAHLEVQGLDCAPHAATLEALHDVGYYRLTAYTYPFRRLLVDGEPRDTPHQFRADAYEPGASMRDAIALCNFDAKLRMKVFDGIAMLEVALRFQIAYVLGKRDKYGHTRLSALDASSCADQPPFHQRQNHATMFDYWLSEYRKLVGRASGEDYLQHFNAKYLGEVPIWIAVETFDFGGLARLFSLMERSDQNKIAARFGISDGKTFHKWLAGINEVRNHCAHHSRLWNRNISRALKGVPTAATHPMMAHLLDPPLPKKLYPWLSVLAYSLRSYDKTTNWHRSVRTILVAFPSIANITPEGHMGFPQGWSTLELWHSAPATARVLPTPSV